MHYSVISTPYYLNKSSRLMKQVFVILLAFVSPLIFSEPINVDKLDNEELLKSATKSIENFQNTEKEFNHLLKIADEYEVSEKNIIEQLANNNSLIDLSKEEDSLEIRIKLLEKSEKLLAEHKELLKQELSLLNKHREKLNNALPLQSGLMHTLDLLFNISSELENRLKKKELLEKDWPKELNDFSTQSIIDRKKELTKNTEKINDNKEKITESIQDIEKQLPKLDLSISDVKEKLKIKAIKWEKHLQVESIKKEFLDKDAEKLAALITSIFLENKNIKQNWEDLYSQFQEKNYFEEIEKLEKKLEESKAPKAEDINLTMKLPSAREIEKEFKTKRKILEYYQQNLKLKELLLKKISDFLEEEHKIRPTLKEYHFLLLKTSTMISVLKDKSEKDVSSLGQENGSSLAGKVEELENIEKSFDKLTQELEVRKQKLQELIPKSQDDIKEQEKSVSQSQILYEEEKQWGEWINRVEKLSLNELKNKLEESLTEIKKQENKIAESQALIEEMRLETQKINEKSKSVQFLLLIRAQNTVKDLYKDAVDSVQKITNGDFEHSLTLNSNVHFSKLREYKETLLNVSLGFSGAVPEPLQQRSEQKLNFLSSLINTFQEKEDFFVQEYTTLEKIVEQSQIALENMDNLAKSARRVYGIMTELKIRLGKGEISEEDIPQVNIKKSGREFSNAVEQEKLSFEKLVDEDIKNLKIIKKISRSTREKRLILEDRQKLISSKLNYLNEIARLDEKLNKSEEDKSETEKKKFAQEVSQKMASEDTVKESMLLFFSSPESENQTELLKSYYDDWIILEKKEKYLEMQIALNEKLWQTTIKEEEVVQRFYEVLQKIDTFSLQSAVDIAEIELAIKPKTHHPRIMEELKKQDANILIVSYKNKTLEEAADQVFRAWVMKLAGEAWYKSMRYELSKLGLDSERGEYTTKIGFYKSKQAQIQPKIKELTGHPARSIKLLEEFAKPKTSEEIYRYNNGEIAYTRGLRVKNLNKAALALLFNLITIPLFAFFFIRLSQRGGRHIINGYTKTAYIKEREQEQRAKTLTALFNTVITTIIAIIALIYILKLFNLNVVPLVASASVVGVALAFGAQALIRDYFAGFFIILENQYMTGDLIRIGEHTGYVQDITFRMTVLRSLEGVVHYLPNGAIERISNLSKQWSRAIIEVGVSYKENVDQAIDILHQVAKDIKKSPKVGDMVLDDYDVLGVEGFDNNAVNLKMWIKTTPGDQFFVKREALRLIKIYFDHYDITIPFPQRVLHQESPLEELEKIQKKKDNLKLFYNVKEKLIENIDGEITQAVPQEIKKEIEKIEMLEKKRIELEKENQSTKEIDEEIEKVLIGTSRKKEEYEKTEQAEPKSNGSKEN